MGCSKPPFSSGDVGDGVPLDSGRGAEAVAPDPALATDQAALHHSQEQYRLLFERMAEGFSLHDAICDESGECVDYRFLEVNPAFERLTGLRRDDVIGKTVREVLPRIEDEWIRACGQVAMTGTPFRSEHHSTPLDRWYDVMAFCPQHGQFATVFLDVTARKLAEEALRESRADLSRAQEVAKTGSWRLDVRANELRWSEETYRIFGIPRGTPLTYEIFLSRVHADDRDHVNEKWTAAVHGEAPYDVEHRILVGETTKWVRETAELEFDSAGDLMGGFGTVQDITDRKGVEADRINSEQQLRRLNAELEDRVARRTDELRHRAEQLSRLASELTLTEQRERRRLAQLLHDHLQQLLVGARLGLEVLSRRVEADQLQALRGIQGLLDESIAASRSLTVELSPPILHEAGLAAGLAWLARWMEDKHGLRVDVEIDDDAVTDREDVRVLVFESARELLFNVVKHSQAKSARIELARHDDEHLRVVVHDEGAGFDLTSMKNGLDGSGFGLFSIRERLGMLGGRMEIESRPQQGSHVTLIAPMRNRRAAAREPAGPHRAPAERAVAAAAAGGDGQRIRVLLVDDHSVMRQGLSVLLAEEEDIEVVGQASDGAEAVELARSLVPDVVLMDFSMPIMDGVQATRAICRELPDVRIIGLSMYEEADRAEAMLDAGAVAYVTKSGRPDMLLATIRNRGSRGN